MKPRQISSVFLFVACVSLALACNAETITFSSGRVLEGKIVEETDTYIAFEYDGVTLKYFKDEIVRINRDKNTSKPSPAPIKRVANASTTGDHITITLKEDPNKDLPSFLEKLEQSRNTIRSIVDEAIGKISISEGTTVTAEHRAVMEEAAEAMQPKINLIRSLQVPPAARRLRDIAIKIVEAQTQYFGDRALRASTVEQLKEYWEKEVSSDIDKLTAQYQEYYSRLTNTK